jgi:hypothetical protein
MKVSHQKIEIELENEKERQLLLQALYLACELGETAVRENHVSDLLVRAGLEPLDTRGATALRDFAERLRESL